MDQKDVMDVLRHELAHPAPKKYLWVLDAANGVPYCFPLQNDDEESIESFLYEDHDFDSNSTWMVSEHGVATMQRTMKCELLTDGCDQMREDCSECYEYRREERRQDARPSVKVCGDMNCPSKELPLNASGMCEDSHHGDYDEVND